MIRRALLLVMLLGAGAGGWALWRGMAGPTAPPAYQGYVEGELLFIGPEEAGRLEHLAVRPGDEVAEGMPLFALDTALQEAQRAEAEARLHQARAQLDDLLAAQQRPEQIAVLRAAERRAEAAFDYSRTELERQRVLTERGVAARARLDEAQAAFERDQAALAEARRQIEAAELAARPAQIQAAEAALRMADAALHEAEAQLARRRIAAPAAGIVQEVYFRDGEAVPAGQPVLALLPPGNRKVRFYLPEPAVAAFPLGRVVSVTCDGCGAGIQGRVSFTSREVEFTPPVIYSQEERARLVFRAEARLDDPATQLPLGLPVMVRLQDHDPLTGPSP